tara:strand:- start:3910 stop:6015 length:2106 start_codon:yes stop_codon:yes gene_type:complete
MSKYNNSSYWMNDYDDDTIVVDQLSDNEKKSLDLYKLASSKRAISNFVNIVTNDNIRVSFKERGDSYTDGKSVVIGSRITEPKDFDVAVGLALHEGSHIKLSDFKLLNDLYNLIPTHITEGAIKKGIYQTQSIIKNLWNYVEDRRIDNFVFKSAPGYRDYYRKMYDKYFNDTLIDKGLLSDEYRDETIESYMFRIINLHNKNTKLSSLNGLREIYKIVNLRKIGRLTDSKETLDVAIEIFKVILSSMADVGDTDSNKSEDSKGNSKDSDSNEQGSDDGQGGSSDNKMSDEDFDNLMDSIGESPIGGGDDNTPTGGGGMDIGNMPDNMDGGSPSNDTSPSKSSVELSDRQKELLKKKIEKQKKFLDGDIQKTSVSKTDSKNLNAIEESGSEIKEVGKGINSGYYHNQSTQCIVVKKLTKGLFESELFPMTRNNYWDTDTNGLIQMEYQQYVDKGIKLGTMLGKKLQVRGEDKSTVFNRQKVGKIDRRMISSLGFGNENVFQFTEIDSYKKANLHISVDASSSMGGSKWEQTITNVVSMAKAVDMISNLNIQITFRCTTQNKPYIVLAYDSRVDKFSKVKQFFGGLRPNGTTPEGLCFEAIMKEFVPINNDLDSYFLNLSDGQPYFPGQGFYYAGDVAERHTNKMVKMIESMGIQTLSYYVSDYSYAGEERSFKKMYGKSAKFIDVTNLNQITKTMNQLFLQK